MNKRYAALLAVFPADESGSIAASNIFDVLDNAIYLDAITDYMLSASLWRLEEASAEAPEPVPAAQTQAKPEAVEGVAPDAAVERTPPAEAGSNASDQDKDEMRDFLHSL